jgi:hypothetical protein
MVQAITVTAWNMNQEWLIDPLNWSDCLNLESRVTYWPFQSDYLNPESRRRVTDPFLRVTAWTLNQEWLIDPSLRVTAWTLNQEWLIDPSFRVTAWTLNQEWVSEWVSDPSLRTTAWTVNHSNSRVKQPLIQGSSSPSDWKIKQC